MHLDPSWPDIAMRLALTMVASGLVGWNREAAGHAAGIRTTSLVALAAAATMILSNRLLGVDGKTATSFVGFDVLRLPLGILTGVGFIGGGAILKRGGLVLGLTTAATLWIATVIGLCFGAGEFTLGIVATLLVTATLWAIPYAEARLNRDYRAVLTLTALRPDAVEAAIQRQGYRIRRRAQKTRQGQDGTTVTWEIRWIGHEMADPLAPIVAAFTAIEAVEAYELSFAPRH